MTREPRSNATHAGCIAARMRRGFSHGLPAAAAGRPRLHVFLLAAGLVVGMGAPIVSAQSAGDPATAPAVAPAPLHYAEVVEEARALVRADLAARGYPGIDAAAASRTEH